MKKLRQFLNQFQLQYHRADTLHKFVVLTALTLCMVTLVSLRLAERDANDTLAALQQQAAILEQENQELQSRIEGLGTADSVKQIAQEELGLVDSDTIIFEQEN